jgi:hypothetical protein
MEYINLKIYRAEIIKLYRYIEKMLWYIIYYPFYWKYTKSEVPNFHLAIKLHATVYISSLHYKIQFINNNNFIILKIS